MTIPGAWIITPPRFHDNRGTLAVWFQQDLLEPVLGSAMPVRQSNCAVSAAGAIRGIHVTDVPPGQAKHVTCPYGAVFDVVVDLREGSPTFGEWDAVLLDDAERRAVYLSEGLGHAVMSLQDGSVITYLCSSDYVPERERTINPLDPHLAIEWPDIDRRGRPMTPLLSPRDAAAPTLEQARLAGALPRLAPHHVPLP
ncbi:dTDP-4-dehydrorhamnose 3,5-epimerase [Phytoactinopolyspora limicola]|uniref:dTDP-4-dehydrorhamnose 3,5-epimerase family protein n=1 Tax=Phytoactinopolyspora limicola TaxID=2715536 RepID=UPI00140AC3A6